MRQGWLKPFEEDIRQLGLLHLETMKVVSVKASSKHFQPLMERLDDGHVDAGDREALLKAFWEAAGLPAIISDARKEAVLHLRLQEVYRRVAEGSNEEVEAYARLLRDARMPMELLQLIVPPRSDDEDE